MKGVLSMKKLISLILTLALCLTAVSAFAETKTDFTAEQISISVPENAEGLGKVELNGRDGPALLCVYPELFCLHRCLQQI